MRKPDKPEKPEKQDRTRVRVSLRPHKPFSEKGRAYRTTIVGQVLPPEHAATVQVWILAGDGLWYLQPRLDLCAGGRFNVLGFFGNPDSEQGNPYQVVATVDAEPTQSPTPTLPVEGVRSNTVHVVRQDTPTAHKLED